MRLKFSDVDEFQFVAVDRTKTEADLAVRDDQHEGRDAVGPSVEGAEADCFHIKCAWHGGAAVRVTVPFADIANVTRGAPDHATELSGEPVAAAHEAGGPG